eukprot:1622752-Amphidinium_carterae.1
MCHVTQLCIGILNHSRAHLSVCVLCHRVPPLRGVRVLESMLRKAAQRPARQGHGSHRFRAQEHARRSS